MVAFLLSHFHRALSLVRLVRMFGLAGGLPCMLGMHFKGRQSIRTFCGLFIFSCSIAKFTAPGGQPKLSRYLVRHSCPSQTIAALAAPKGFKVDRGGLSYLTTFRRKAVFSLSETFLLGNVGWKSAACIQLWADGCDEASFFRGSLSLSSSLREALPPMFLIRDSVTGGPISAMA